jgi:hypothetical protein
MNPQHFNAVELHRCVSCMDAGMNRYVEQVEEGCGIPDEAVGPPFWSVYLHHAPERSKGTGLECVADCAVPEHAELVAQALRVWLNTTT